MECPNCGRRVESGDRFCNGCGTSLLGVTDTTQIVAVVSDDESAPDETPAVDDGSTSEPDQSDDAPTELLTFTDDDEMWGDEPAWAPTGSLPTTAPDEAATITDDLPVTEPMPEAVTEPPAQPVGGEWMRQVTDEPAATTPYDFTEREPVDITGELDTPTGATATMPIVSPTPIPPAPRRFGFSLILLISLVTGIVSLVALFGNIVTITSDTRLVLTEDTPPDFRTGTWILDDLADNMSIAGLIAVVAMVAGGVASGFRWRWGSGLAGGAGLAMAGVAALAIGLAQFPIDAAHAFARVPTDDPFVLTITRDLGYWLLVGAGALGVVLFFAATNDAFGDRRPGLNPWIAALGALAIVVAAAGPLLPEKQAIFSDNWYLIEGVGEPSALLLVGRLVQLGLFLAGGVIGFLSVRRWGLGLAIGAALPGVWLVISTLLDITDRPVGLGFSNPGAVDMHIHGVTIIGISAVLAMIVLAVVGAYDQGVRERP